MDQYMKAALDEARQGAEEGGIPIGAALVDTDGNLFATGGNRRVQDRAVVIHGECRSVQHLHNGRQRVGKLPGPRVRTEERLPNREFPIIQDRGWVVRRRLAFSLVKTQPAATVRKRDMDLAAAMPSVDSLEPTQ